MELTEQNLLVYAAANYDNIRCLSVDEFCNDLEQVKTIKRMMSKYINGCVDINIRLMINNIIIFYNCFKHDAATKILQLKINTDHIGHYNAILTFLNLPLLVPQSFVDMNFYNDIYKEYREF